MRKILLVLCIAILVNLLSACSSSKTDAPAKAVEDYLSALAAKDANRMPSLVCGDWEDAAMTALDSLQAVTARLDNVSCKQTGSDGSTALVNCTGKIVMTYNNEDSDIDISTQTYQVVQQGGDWLVCGTR